MKLKNVVSNVLQSLFTGATVYVVTGDANLAATASLIVSMLLPDRK